MTSTDAPARTPPDPDLTADRLAELLGDAVGDAFRAITTQLQSQRGDLTALTMSGLGGCTRQAAYRVARTPPSEPWVFGEVRTANLGTMIHAWLVPVLADLLAGVPEIKVVLHQAGLVIEGRSDLYLGPLATVADLKTTNPYTFATLSEVINRSHRLQVAGYGLAVRESGRPVDWVAWIYLDRSSGAEFVVVEPLGEELETLVAQRCEELAAYAGEPDAAPRDERGPGLSVICDGCPWLRACWGTDARPGEVGAQRALVHNDADMEAALALYDRGRAMESEGKDLKAFARAMFDGHDPGVYGGWEFGYSGGAGETDDKDAAIEMLVAAGLPKPTKRTTRKLFVRRKH